MDRRLGQLAFSGTHGLRMHQALFGLVSGVIAMLVFC